MTQPNEQSLTEEFLKRKGSIDRRGQIDVQSIYRQLQKKALIDRSRVSQLIALIRFYSLLWSKQLKGQILKSVPQIFAKYLPFLCKIFATKFPKQDLPHFSRLLPYLQSISNVVNVHCTGHFGLHCICRMKPMHVGVFAHQISI